MLDTGQAFRTQTCKLGTNVLSCAWMSSRQKKGNQGTGNKNENNLTHLFSILNVLILVVL